MKKAWPFLLLVVILAGCYGSPVHESRTYSKRQKKIKKNNAALLKLKVGMTQDHVSDIMGKPQMSEGYAWGSAWLYRTAMASGVYGHRDADFTPVMFDKDETLIGWGRNFFEAQVKKYEITIEYK